jgi:hypothetical protein
MNLWPVVCWTGLLAPTLAAPGAGQVQILSVDGTPGRDARVPLERFIEPRMVIPMTLLTLPGERPSLKGDLYLDGGELGALLLENLDFHVAAAAGHPALAVGEFAFAIPEAVKEGRLRLVVRSGLPDSRVPAGEVRVQLVDREKVKQNLVAHGRALRTLAVFGRSPGLREMLKEWRVPFEDLGPAVPDRIQSGALAVGDVDAEGQVRIPDLQEKAALLLVQNSPEELEGIKEIKSDDKLMILANRRQAGEWRHQPLLHKLLIQIIQHQLSDHE